MNDLTPERGGKGFAAFISDNRYPLIAFAVTQAVLIIYLIVRKMLPFGDNSFLAIDLYEQYYPMIIGRLRGLFANPWSWEGALGFNAYAQNAYYTNSPLYLLMLPFTGTARLAVFDLIVTFRISLCALTGALFLEYKFKKKTILTSAVGVAFALSSYSIAFITQVMWMDVVMLAPVVMIGIEELISKKRILLYAVSLAACIYLNFYAAFSLCVFCVLYYIVTYVSSGKSGIKKLAADTGRFALGSLLSGMLSAPTVLSVYSAIKNTAASAIPFDWKAEIYDHGIEKISDALTPASGLSLEYGVANIYSISAIVLFCVMFLLNKNIPLRRRLSYFLFGLFMFLSFELNILDYIWHGFHFPNQLPGRWSYLFIFIVLVMAYEAIINIASSNIIQLCISALAAGAVLMIGSSGEKKTGHIIGLAIMLVSFAVCAVPVLFRKFKNGEWVVCTALAFMILCETLSVSMYNLSEYGYVSGGSYFCEYESDMDVLTEKYNGGTDDFYRSEFYPRKIFNDGTYFGFNGLTYYSSTMNKNVYELFKNLGNHVYAQNVSSLFTCTPVLDMMFGIKYRYTGSATQAFPFYDKLETQGKVSAYENRYALPVSYVVSDEIKEMPNELFSGIELQNEFIRCALGKNVTTFYGMDCTDIELENCRVSNGYLTPLNQSEPMKYTKKFVSGGDESYYVSVGFRVGTIEVKADGVTVYNGNAQNYELFPLDSLPEGTEISVTVTVSGYQYVLYGIEMFALPEVKLSTVHRLLGESAIDVTRATNTEISGTIDVKKAGVLYSSVPYGEGWSLYIDGKKAETYPIMNTLIGADITEGMHDISYKYTSPGRAAGVIISIVGLAVLFGVTFVTRKVKKEEDISMTEKAK